MWLAGQCGDTTRDNVIYNNSNNNVPPSMYDIRGDGECYVLCFLPIITTRISYNRTRATLTMYIITQICNDHQQPPGAYAWRLLPLFFDTIGLNNHQDASQLHRYSSYIYSCRLVIG